MTKNKDYVRLTIGMTSDFKRQLRKAAAIHDKTMSEFILMILKECVKRMDLDKKA
jgi:uncharacterized protein (DUF1778 family)